VFSAERAFVVLADLARAPHMPGSVEHDRVRERIVTALELAGFEVDVQETTVVVRRGRLVHAVSVRNVLGRKRGTASTGGVALASHYDTEQLAPGAGDDGAAVAATLEAVRALAHGEPLRNDLYVIVTDAEELGLLGARAFVEQHPWWPEITVLLNFEARGSAGASVMFETSAGNAWAVREFARADPYPVASSLFFEIYERLPNDTDFSVYKHAGVTGLNFAFVEGADAYHRPSDSIENLSAASLQHHGEHALALGRHFGNLDLNAAAKGPNLVYFRVPGLGLVSYSSGFAVAFMAGTLLLGGFVIFRGVVARRLTWIGMGAGLAVVLAATVLAATAAAALVAIIAAVHHEVGSIIGRELYDESWYGLAVACAAVASYATAFAVARPRAGAPSLAAGGLLIPFAFATAATLYAPGVSMLFVWPSIFAVVAILWLVTRRADEPFDGADLTILAFCAACAIMVFFPLVWAVYIGFSVAGAPLLAAIVILMLALLVPLFELAAGANRWWLPAMGYGLAVVFTAVGVSNARSGPDRPVPEDLVYALDRDSGEALWATAQPSGGVWLPRFFAAATGRGDLGAFLVEPGAYRLAPAPLIAAPRADVVVNDGVDGELRSIRVAIRPVLGPELINVLPVAGGPVELRAVNGVAVPSGVPFDWKLQHFGRPPDGELVLDLATQDLDGPIELAVIEVVMRLPAVPEAERPAGVTAHLGRLTDRSLFRQVVRIE
jgi:MFS family permease